MVFLSYTPPHSLFLRFPVRLIKKALTNNIPLFFYLFFFHYIHMNMYNLLSHPPSQYRSNRSNNTNMSAGDTAVQVFPAEQADNLAAVRDFEVGPKRSLKHKETLAEHDSRLYGSDKISQHIKKFDVNGDGNFNLAEVKMIVQELEADEAKVKGLKKVIVGVIFVSLALMGVLLGIIIGVSFFNF